MSLGVVEENDESKLQQMMGPDTDAELARLIEKTYNYIYSVEEKRTIRTINKVEDLFDSAPIMFDDTKVTAQLTRLKKIKQDANMLKGHVQVYNEQMAEQKHMREHIKFLIEKHDIRIDEEIERT